MAGKGDTRRPKQISDIEEAARWAATFGTTIGTARRFRAFAERVLAADPTPTAPARERQGPATPRAPRAPQVDPARPK